MQFSHLKQFANDELNESVGIRYTLEKYLSNFKWFLLTVFLMLCIAFIYLRYTVPTYRVEGTILIKDLEKESSFDKLSSIEDIGMLGLGNKGVENEIQILNSRTLVSNVVDELNLNFRYLLVQNPYDKELYPNYPIILNILSDSSSIKNIYTTFEIFIRSREQFDVEMLDGTIINNQSFNKEFKANISSIEENDIRRLRLDLVHDLDNSLVGEKIKIVISPFNNVVDSYLNRLNITPVNEKLSSVLSLSIVGDNRIKGIAILNNLVEQYNADGIRDKGLVSQSTSDFLEIRLALIAKELIAIEETAAQYKTSKGMINSAAQANYYLESSTATEGQLMDANTQLQLVAMVESELNQISMSGLLPTNIGLSDPGLVGMITSYNELVLRRNRILNSSSELNPIIQGIDLELLNLRNNLRGSLINLKSGSEIKINSLSKQTGNINSKIAAAPEYEKDFKHIVRQQETKNALYLFLLQKREESILSNAVKIDKSKVIDVAYSSLNPVAPKKSLIYLASIFLGILIPIVIIYIHDLFDTKVHEERDLNKLELPYLGDVPLSKDLKNLFVTVNDKSKIAESFRYLRTNINFMLDSKEMGKTVFVTSTLSGEGKSFTAINLARSLALSSKKTLLIGMDLRAPKISKYLNIKESKGVSNFIYDSDLDPQNIISKSEEIENMYVISSGDIPPNPVELLMSKRVNELFTYCKENFDYIVVDTSPVGMVTDTIQISYLADLTIFVIKADYLDKKMLHIVNKLNHEKKLKNIAFLINGTVHKKNDHYGYGYGYGENSPKKKWYKRLFNTAAI